MEELNQAPPQDHDFLQDVFIHIYDAQLNPQATEIANTLCASITDDLVPFLTTHVLTVEVTSQLRNEIN